MKTFSLQTRLDATGRLRLDVPIADGPREVDVVLVVSPHDIGAAGTPSGYDFSDLVGTLRWKGDAVAEQRGLRDEW